MHGVSDRWCTLSTTLAVIWPSLITDKGTTIKWPDGKLI